MNERPAPPLLRLADLLGDWEADAAARHAAYNGGAALGPVTGLTRLDALIGSALMPGLHVLHGAPGTGKTALALQIACACACPALYVSCEMSALELLRRITARVTKTYLGRFKTGELTPDVSLGLARTAARETPRLALLDGTQAGIPPADLLTRADAVRALESTSPHRLLIVDSLHAWAEGVFGAAAEYEALNAGLAALRQIAARLDCPILLIAERNRGAMREGGLSAGAGSRKIEYGAETVFDLDAKEAALEDASGEKAVVLTIRKNRHGPPGGQVPLRFHGALQRFREGT